MRITSLVLFVFAYVMAVSQVNDSPLSAYEWKGKKTTLSPGYVILNSGKKLEGEISLSGKNGNVTGIYFEGDGKEINFPLSAIKSYGLDVANNAGGTQADGYYSGPIICDNNEDLFTWRDMGVQMGKQINNTKPRNGYVIKRDGTEIEGQLQIKKVNGQFHEFEVKAESGKFKIPARDVGHYGLQMHMAELNKNGEKNYNDEAKNFHKGNIILVGGKKIEGFVAFKEKQPINSNRPGEGDKYNGMYYAKDENAYVKSYSDNQVIAITQVINGEEVIYSPYEGGFVASTAMDNAKYVNKTKAFNEGVLTLADGTKEIGDIAISSDVKINFRGEDGLIKAFSPKDVKKLKVEIGGETYHYISAEDLFTEELFNGKTFWVYENPRPTTVNERKTNAANNMMNLGTSLASSAVLNQTEKSMGTDMNLDSIVRSSSTADIIKAREDMARLYGFNSVEEMETKGIPDNNAAKLDAALQLELASRQNNSGIVIYYEEIIVINKNTQERIVLYKDKDLMNDKLEGLLMGCYEFLELDKKEQKSFYDIDNVKVTFKMLDACY